MTETLAPYMRWAKSRPHVTIDLALSNVMACSASDLPGAASALDFSGQNDNGFPPLLEAIAARYGVAASRVATATGTSGANFLAGLAFIKPGDDVIVEGPAYDPLLAIPRALGANVIRFERRAEHGFAIDPDDVRRALTPRTTLVVVTQPHNPSGAVSTPETLARLASDAAAHGAHVLVDEVYLDVSQGCGAPPAAQLGENVISTNSLTKSYGLAALRCGWAIGSDDTAERIRRARDIVDGTGSLPAERLAVLAFAHLDALAARAREIIDPNVARFRAFLAESPHLEGFAVRGTVAFPRLRSGADARGFADHLLRAYQTAVVPGSFFGAPAHMRIGLGVSPETLEKGLENIRKALGVGPR